MTTFLMIAAIVELGFIYNGIINVCRNQAGIGQLLVRLIDHTKEIERKTPGK